MKYSSASDIGMVRSVNQDRCAVVCPSGDACFAVVCDGMGGANAGETAAQMALDTVVSRIEAGWREGISGESVRNLLLTSITAANINVYDKATTEPECSGMGTTVVACAVIKNDAIVAHAGDSRAYLFSDGLRRITKDHSYVQALVDMGRITSEQAEHHPKKNYITRALGIEEFVELEFDEVHIKKGDILLLCSDGLSNFVSEENISDILKRYGADAADPLIAEANANGGGDNVTAVVISR